MKVRINDTIFENVFVFDNEKVIRLIGNIDESILTLDISDNTTIEILSEVDEVLSSITVNYGNRYVVEDDLSKSIVFQKVTPSPEDEITKLKQQITDLELALCEIYESMEV